MASSKYADEGTIAHILAALCLTEEYDAAAYVGRLLESSDYEHAKLSPSGAKRWMTCPGSHALIAAQAGEFQERSFSMEVTEDMAEHVQVYVDMVRDRVEQRKLEGAIEVILLVEQSLPIGPITGEEDATGTGDVVIVSVWEDGHAELDLIDLKFGRGVEVQVEGNEQLQMYGCGALANLDLLYNFTRARLTVHQPRVKREPSDWEIDIQVLRDFEEKARADAQRVHAAVTYFKEWGEMHDKYMKAGSHCRSTFCEMRATCKTAAQAVIDEVGADFEVIVEEGSVGVPEVVAQMKEHGSQFDGAALGLKMAAVDWIEDWCKAVRAEVERRLLAGQEVDGFKLVQGKRGARAWANEADAEATLKSMRIKHDQMYNYSLISPTAAEKLAPKFGKDGKPVPDQPDTVIKPKQWAKLKELITQSDGKPSVAPVSDKRPALVITPAEDDFEPIEDDLAG